MSRLVVFALGGVFGALALHALAPRVRDVVERYEAPAIAAVASGAERASLKTLEVEDIPIAYLPGGARRVRVRVIGDIAFH